MINSQQWKVGRDDLLHGLKAASGVVESAQVLQILSHVHITVNADQMTLVTSDSEVEIKSCVKLAETTDSRVSVAVSCRKLLDVCRSLLADTVLEFNYIEGWLEIKALKASFKLATLPANDFPFMQSSDTVESIFNVESQQFRFVMHKTCFAMAHQDVRFFLNGLFLETKANNLVATATDGHRLARCTLKNSLNSNKDVSCIIPRKAVAELLRLMKDDSSNLEVTIALRSIKFVHQDFVLTSTLLEGNYPSCDRLLSLDNESEKAIIDSVELKHVLSRAAILSHDKFRGGSLSFTPNYLSVSANNAEMEKSQDGMTVDYSGKNIELSFNISYLLDVIAVLSKNSVCLHFASESKSVLLTDPNQEQDLYESVFLVMPLSL